MSIRAMMSEWLWPLRNESFIVFCDVIEDIYGVYMKPSTDFSAFHTVNNLCF